MSQREGSRVNLEQEQESALSKVRSSMREAFDQESALLQARHQSDLDEIKRQSREEQERRHELHLQEMSEFEREWFSVQCFLMEALWSICVNYSRFLVGCSIKAAQNDGCCLPILGPDESFVRLHVQMI